jgi:hypothetical protein
LYQPDQAASVAHRFFRFRFPREARADPPETKRILGLGSLRLIRFLMFGNHFTSKEKIMIDTHNISSQKTAAINDLFRTSLK